MEIKVPKICFISPSPTMAESICERLAKEGFQVDWVRDTKQALSKLRHTEYAAVVSDIYRCDMSGAHFLRKLRAEINNAPPALFISGNNADDQAEKTLNPTAIVYFPKTLDLKPLTKKLNEICHMNLPGYSQKADSPLGISPSMCKVEEKIQILAPYNQTPVLINGESGVGKEVAARRLHTIQDASAPFVAINCAAIPSSLIESELFGHEKGAFTGSTSTHKGVFEQANGGTLLLDEIGEMPLATQAKLLRVIQEQTVVRLGGEKAIKVNLRIICATNCDLRSKVASGEFREDLYYRINVIELYIPPLRRRLQDIHWLVNKFLDDHSKYYPGKIKR